LLASQAKTIRAIGGAGAGGRSAGRLGRVASLQIGRFTIENPITLFSEDSAGAFADAALAGNLGAQIAKRFRMFLDYGRRRLTLEPSSAFAEPFDRAFSGVALRAEGADYRTFRVREVLGDSPASEAGILAGDIVTAIGGTAAATLTLPAINEMLEKPVTRQLVIRRGDQMLTVALTPRPLI
jgi:predicted metalloprotease with PDZ domain